MKSNLNNKQIEPLLGLGLTKIQATLYLTTLQYGLLSALELSRLTKVSRQQVYEASEKLIELGLLEITRKNRKKYVPADPSMLTRLGQNRMRESERLIENLSLALPSIEELVKAKKPKIVTRYYEGLQKVKVAYAKELIESKKTEVLSFVGSIDDIFNFLPESYWAKWNKQFVRQGSHSRMLVHQSKTAQKTAGLDKAYNRQTRYIENFPLKINIDVFNNIVLVSSYYDELAIWIESSVLAQSYRIMFNALWVQAKSF